MIRGILNAIDEAIHAVDKNGITIFYNEVAARHDGLTPREVLGKHVLEAFPSLTKETSTLLQVLQTKQAIVQQAQRYQNINGQFIDTINTTIPIMLQGQLVGAVEIAKDYSTIKKLGEKVLDLQARVNPPSRKRDAKNQLYTTADILTNDPALLQVKKQLEKVAYADSSVLVVGETGTGKELFVQAIHALSPRNQHAFIAQNCAALPESLLESLLFGTTKGSYTGAVDRPGLFELADGGTLFLDEMNSMPLELQAKLLRVLEDGIVRRIGNQKTCRVNVRIIAAINESPLDCVQKGTIRPDLYYRLNVFSLLIPPLRERSFDIELLTSHFIEMFNHRFQKNVQNVDHSVLQLFHQYHWPGNVRELKHTIEHAMIMADGVKLSVIHLPLQLQQMKKSGETKIRPLREVLQETETALIQEALRQTGGNIQRAAILLDLPRQTLQYKLQKQTKV
ncbi:sigma 54-interacting transcriptional regulator [Ectobacillus sp. JY-23]|uniref:sigma-54 interaction domain-containing protein n=1 Tax=Ectobacillus sp. JY-23 TaxID=2933872 RepID=UPI001FF2F424|nr:sigma 54-interacting transcriptional regulator [Ectobacillus sp. JY-23]UOY94431.1 sigma 54-interacting transcriptional regulator [Ectobacillus sp. JY-23]